MNSKILFCTRLIGNAKIIFLKSTNVILKIGMDIVLMNLECAFLSVCHFPCLRAGGHFPVPYKFFSHFLIIGLCEMEKTYLKD